MAEGGAAKAGVGSSRARATAAAAAAAVAATASKRGVATLPASLLRSPATASTNQFHLVLELTRRSGAKRILLEAPLPRAVNPVTNRLLASFPGLAY